MAYARYAVIIVTYNRRKLLHECICQIKAQTVPAERIIIVNNASTDGTDDYLKKLSAQEGRFHIITCPENIGGAGGFAKGIDQAVEYDIDCVLLIDDDAILSPDYMEILLTTRKKRPEYKAFAGAVKVRGSLDICHRKNLSRIGLLMKNCPVSAYQNTYFECDVASFCGMLVDKNLIGKIGFPHAEYFIWHDDAEYSLRIHKYSRFLVVPGAVLNHKTIINKEKSHPRRYEWRDYYAVRNRICMLKEHGNLLDRIVNYMNLFVHVVFRNWWFGFIRMDQYNWKYEKNMVRKAIKDANNIKLS